MVTVTCRLCDGPLEPTGAVCGDRPDLDVHRCLDCGAVQVADIAHATTGFYASDAYFPADWSVDWDREAHWNEKRVERCRAQLPDAPGRSLLDVGCGIGGFLRRAAPHFRRVVGFDLSRRVVERHRADGFEAFHDLDAVTGHIDTLVLFHVLEHVPEPWSLLDTLLRRFPAVDRVVVETPNTDEILMRRFDVPAFRRVHYSAEHIWYFTGATLERALGRAGLTIVHRGQLQRYTLGNLLGWIGQGRGGGQAEWPVFATKPFHDAYEAALERVGLADSVWLVATPADRVG